MQILKKLYFSGITLMLKQFMCIKMKLQNFQKMLKTYLNSQFMQVIYQQVNGMLKKIWVIKKSSLINQIFLYANFSLILIRYILLWFLCRFVLPYIWVFLHKIQIKNRPLHQQEYTFQSLYLQLYFYELYKNLL